MILIIDNYDSFVYNLAQYFGTIEKDIKVIRNDKIDAHGVGELKPEKLVISPGPGRPENGGNIVDIIKKWAGKIPLLGVCLGHQAIGYAFGGEIIKAPEIMHGKTCDIFHDGHTIFEGIKSPFTATRYHSLIVKRDTLPACFQVTAEAGEGIIMGLRHKTLDRVEGVQFHPESLLTKEGMKIVENFLSL